MFDADRVRAVLALHERSFALLTWVRQALREGRLSFAVAHDSTDSSAAAAEWIGRHSTSIPVDARPERAELETFARLFASFLTTSFRLTPTTVRRYSLCGGCYCSWCSYLQASPDLAVRMPEKKDFQTAQELKRIYLQRLAEERQTADRAAAVQKVLDQAELKESVALATWTAEILRRAEFASQGPAVLALWREFAWEGGKPRKKFQMRAELALAAEAKIAEAMESEAG